MADIDLMRHFFDFFDFIRRSSAFIGG